MNHVATNKNYDKVARNVAGAAERAGAVLCGILADGVDIHRCAAAQALGRIGGPMTVKALIAALHDEDEDVRIDAATALARLADPAAAEPLMENLIGDPSSEVKLAAIDALVRLRHGAVVPWLTRLVRGRDAEMAWDEDEFHTGGWDDWVDIQVKAIEALADFGAEDAVPEIVAAIQDEHGQDLTEIGFKALARLGVPGRAALVEFEASKNDRWQQRAAAAQSDGDDGTEILASPMVGAAVEMPVESVEVLVERLGDDNRQTRLEAMGGLAAIAAGDEAWPNDAGDALLAALAGELVPAPEPPEPQPEAEPQTEKKPDTVDTVEDEEADSELPVPTSTLQAILDGNVEADETVAAPEQGVELTREDMERLAHAVRQPKKRVVSVTPDVTLHQDVRRFAARVLGDLAWEDVALALTAALDDEDREVRLAAADSLARVAEGMAALPAVAVQSLEANLITKDHDLRLSLVRALGHSGDPGVNDALRKLTRDGDSFVRTEAVRGLARTGAIETEAKRLLGDAEPGVRLAAAEAIASLGGADALDHLIDFTFAFEGYHRRPAARMLRRLDPAAASDRFVDALGDLARKRLWQVAIEALEEIHRADPGASAQSTRN